MGKSSPSAISLMRRPLIIAHRGANREAPENSRSAFDAALKYRVAGIELDIQLTGDDIPVLYHDATLSRIGKGRQKIGDFTYAELKTFEWGRWFSEPFSKEPLMTLDDVLKRYCLRTRLMMEIKSREQDRRNGRHLLLTRKVIESIRRHIPSRRIRDVFVLSFDPEVLAAAASQDSSLNYILNAEDPEEINLSSRSRGLSLFALGLPVKKLTPAFTKMTHRLGLRVITWSCNVPRQVDSALSGGADILLTDNPGWLTNILDSRFII